MRNCGSVLAHDESHSIDETSMSGGCEQTLKRRGARSVADAERICLRFGHRHFETWTICR